MKQHFAIPILLAALAASLCGQTIFNTCSGVSLRQSGTPNVWVAQNATDRNVQSLAIVLDIQRGRRFKPVHVTFDDTVATGESAFIVKAGGETPFTFRNYLPGGDPAKLAGYVTDYQNPARLTLDYVEFSDGSSCGPNVAGARERFEARKSAWTEALRLSTTNPERLASLSGESLDATGPDAYNTFLHQYARRLAPPPQKEQQGFLDWVRSLAFTVTSVTCSAQPYAAFRPLWNVFPFECGDINYNGGDPQYFGYVGRVGLTQGVTSDYITGYTKKGKQPIYRSIHMDASIPQEGFHCLSLQVVGGAYHSGLNVPDANNCNRPTGQTSCCTAQIFQQYAWTEVLGSDPRATSTDWTKFCDATVPDVVSGSMTLVCGY